MCENPHTERRLQSTIPVKNTNEETSILTANTLLELILTSKHHSRWLKETSYLESR